MANGLQEEARAGLSMAQSVAFIVAFVILFFALFAVLRIQVQPFTGMRRFVARSIRSG